MPPIPNIPPALVGSKQGSFAFITVRDRWPKIMAKVVDCVHRLRHSHVAAHEEDGDDDIKLVLSELSELRYLVTTDKPLQDLIDNGENVNIWNEELKELRMKRGVEETTWFCLDWLFVECYLYRRIASSFMRTKTLKEFDPFASQKQSAFIISINSITILAKYLEEITLPTATVDDNIISHFLMVCLWGNKCDLSLSCGESVTSSSPLDMVEQLADKVLCNQIDEAQRIINSNAPDRVDIVLDNAGLELFGDLALAELLISKRGISKVHFHGKSLPWFVSDVTGKDFNWIIEMLLANSDEILRKFGTKCSKRLSEGSFVFNAHPFWTLPYPFYMMSEKAPDLHRELSHSSLIIFKGDLNYRKLVGDLEWPLDTPFKVSLRGFAPAPVLVLRTLKAETQTGLSSKVIDSLVQKYGTSKSWMVTGEYGVAQFAES